MSEEIERLLNEWVNTRVALRNNSRSGMAEVMAEVHQRNKLFQAVVEARSGKHADTRQVSLPV